jgi:hypothetical protein
MADRVKEILHQRHGPVGLRGDPFRGGGSGGTHRGNKNSKRFKKGATRPRGWLGGIRSSGVEGVRWTGENGDSSSKQRK